MNIIENEFSSTKFGKTYLRIINKARNSHRTKSTEYFEYHHILPRAKGMFPEFISLKENPWNGVLLTPREHYICHALLVQHYRKTNEITKYRKMSRAFFLMSKTNTINSKLYAFLKLDLAQGVGSKPIGFNKGASNGRAKHIKVFNENKECVSFSFGNYIEMLRINNFPKDYFKHLLKYKIFGTNDNYPDFKGWFVKMDNTSFEEIEENTHIYLLKKSSYQRKTRKTITEQQRERMRIQRKGFSTYKDINNITYRTKTDDPRVLSGELISINANVGYKDNLELIEKRKIAWRGSKNPAARIIIIYDSLDNVKFECHGSFESTCKEHNLPFTAFKNSYLNEGKKLYTNIIDGRVYSKLINNGNIKFKNWYAKIKNP